MRLQTLTIFITYRSVAIDATESLSCGFISWKVFVPLVSRRGRTRGSATGNLEVGSQIVTVRTIFRASWTGRDDSCDERGESDVYTKYVTTRGSWCLLNIGSDKSHGERDLRSLAAAKEKAENARRRRSCAEGGGRRQKWNKQRGKFSYHILRPLFTIEVSAPAVRYKRTPALPRVRPGCLFFVGSGNRDVARTHPRR